MSFDFLVVMDLMAGAVANGNDTDSGVREVCSEPINRQLYYLYMLIPATICTVILAFTKKRKNVKTDCCWARPALVFPQNMMSKSNKISFAAAFGAVANICIDVIFESKYAFEYDGPLYLKVFVALLSMMVYGLDFFPLFASLAVENIPGYIIGTLYAWTLCAVEMFRMFKCDSLTALEAGLIVVRDLPLIVCHLYLSVSLPVRVIVSIRDRNKDKKKDLDELVLNSYAGIHVKKILKKPKPPPPEPTTLTGKVLALVKSVWKKVVYFRVLNFRYSVRILCIMTVSFMLIYHVTVEVMIYTIPVFKILETYLINGIAVIGYYPSEGEEYIMTEGRDWLYFIYYMIQAIRACFLVSITVAFTLNSLVLLHSLSTFRSNLLDLYKGHSGYLTKRSEKSNPSLLVGCMRYAGYQVAYIGWGYLIQFMIIFLISVVLAFIIILIRLQIVDTWFLDQFMAVWPVLLTTLVINFIQLLMAKFAFLHKNGAILSIKNRRMFFIVVYFMFFYNIFLGLVSCLLRILKAMILGILFLPRLDHSTLPRRFQSFDPGFDAYCGFMHVESVHTNPVATTFIRMLQEEAFGKNHRKSVSKSQDKYIQMESAGSTDDEAKRRRHRLVIFKWKLVYTLLRNPELILRRKGEILKQLELMGMDRLATASEKQPELQAEKGVEIFEQPEVIIAERQERGAEEVHEAVFLTKC